MAGKKVKMVAEMECPTCTEKAEVFDNHPKGEKVLFSICSNENEVHEHVLGDSWYDKLELRAGDVAVEDGDGDDDDDD